MFIKTKTVPVDSTGDIVTSGDITDGSGNILSDKQDKTLSSSITVEGVTQTTVEGTLNALNNKAGGVQSDWNQNTTTELDYIKNKPTSMPASDVSAWAKASTKPTYAYSEITGTPTLGTAADMNVPESGDAANNEVVLGNDSRLSDSRSASDVYPWAKASTKPTYTASEVGALASNGKASTAGTADQAGKVYVNGPNAYGTITASATDLSNGASINSGDIYLVYE